MKYLSLHTNEYFLYVLSSTTEVMYMYMYMYMYIYIIYKYHIYIYHTDYIFFIYKET